MTNISDQIYKKHNTFKKPKTNKLSGQKEGKKAI